jgi:hypothetical protein
LTGCVKLPLTLNLAASYKSMLHIAYKYISENLKNLMQHRVSMDKAALFFIVFAASLVLFNWYFAGDLCYYRSAYDAVKGWSIYEAFASYRKQMFSADLFHFFLIWIFSKIIAHDLLMAILNGGLAVVIYSLLIERGVSRGTSIALVLFNYYFWVVAIPAERLKIAIIFVSMFYLVRTVGRRLLLLFLGILSHASVAILFVPYFSVTRFSSGGLFSGGSRYSVLLIFLVVAFVVGGDVFAKFWWIADRAHVEFSVILPTLFLGLLALYFSDRGFLAVAPIFVVIASLIFFVSADRLNMLSLLIALGYVVDSNSGRLVNKLAGFYVRDLILWSVSAVLFIKSLGFVVNIYSNGTGFGLLENRC